MEVGDKGAWRTEAKLICPKNSTTLLISTSVHMTEINSLYELYPPGNPHYPVFCPMQMVQKQPQQRLKTKSILDLPPEFHQDHSGLDTKKPVFHIFMLQKCNHSKQS